MGMKTRRRLRSKKECAVAGLRASKNRRRSLRSSSRASTACRPNVDVRRTSTRADSLRDAERPPLPRPIANGPRDFINIESKRRLGAETELTKASVDLPARSDLIYARWCDIVRLDGGCVR